MRRTLSFLCAFALLATALAAPSCLPEPGIERFVINQENAFGGEHGTLSVIDPEGNVENEAGGLLLGLIPNRIAIDRTIAYVTNSGDDTIQLIDLDTLESVATFELAAADGGSCSPWESVIGEEKGYTTCFLSSEVIVWNKTDGTILGHIPLPDADDTHPASPEGLELAGDTLYVANTGFSFADFSYGPGTISVIDTTTDHVTATIATGQVNPQALTVGPDGMLYVVTTGDFDTRMGELERIDPQGGTIDKRFAVGGAPGSLTIDATCNKAYLGGGFGGHLFVVDLTTDEVRFDAQTPLSLTDTPGDFIPALHAWEGRIHAVAWASNALIELDCASDTVTERFTVGDHPADVAIRRSGSR